MRTGTGTYKEAEVRAGYDEDPGRVGQTVYVPTAHRCAEAHTKTYTKRTKTYTKRTKTYKTVQRFHFCPPVPLYVVEEVVLYAFVWVSFLPEREKNETSSPSASSTTYKNINAFANFRFHFFKK